MSETKGTIEERYEGVSRYLWDAELDMIDRFEARYVLSLLDDLMVHREIMSASIKELENERGKMKEKIMKVQGELIELSEALDAWGRPATAGQLMGIHDILEGD